MADTPRLDAYLERIGLSARPEPGIEGLQALKIAHRRSIAFENLDVQLGRVIEADSDSAFAKLVTRRRGGYCFEQNRLFADMLADLGLPTRPLLARVRLNVEGETPPRGHVLLLAEISGEQWIADVGFGGSFVPALPLRDGAEAAGFDGAHHRLRRIGELGDLRGQWLFERRAGESDAPWVPQYTFNLCEVAPNDIEQANHWTQTSPRSRFTTMQLATIVLPGGFASLVGNVFTVSDAQGSREERIESATAYADCLRTHFQLDFSDDEAASLPVFSL